MAFVLSTASERETELFGARLADVLLPGDVVALTGDLGAGKTHFVKGVAEALGIVEPVTSPTFNILLVHKGRLTLYHFDLYRMDRADQLEDIDFWGTLEAGGVSFIEWGDRFPRALPADHLSVAIHREDAAHRRFEVAGTGPRGCQLATDWGAAAGGGSEVDG